VCISKPDTQWDVAFQLFGLAREMTLIRCTSTSANIIALTGLLLAIWRLDYKNESKRFSVAGQLLSKLLGWSVVLPLPARPSDRLSMSAITPKTDMCGATSDVRFGPKADIF
jgi:hypothetical protein